MIVLSFRLSIYRSPFSNCITFHCQGHVKLLGLQLMDMNNPESKPALKAPHATVTVKIATSQGLYRHTVTQSKQEV